jgi:hypothetical protein
VLSPAANKLIPKTARDSASPGKAASHQEEEAFEERAVKAELLPQKGLMLRCSVLSAQDRDGIPRHDLDEDEVTNRTPSNSGMAAKARRPA